MKIVVNIDIMLARRKMSVNELCSKLKIHPTNLSILKNDKARGVRFDTLCQLCKALDCQPGDLLQFVDEE